MMRKSTSLCVLCRHASSASPRPYIRTARQLTTISRREPLELSSLAIDLDAYDSPAVRKTLNSAFDYPDLPIPWPSDLPLSKKTKSILRTPGSIVAKPGRRKDDQQITPPDILQWALADDIPKNINYRGIGLFRHGIRKNDTVQTKAEQLAFEYTLYASEWDPSFILSRTERYRTLRRILSLQVGTHQGCVWLSQHGSMVRKAFRACALHAAEVVKVGGDISPVEPLSILNDILWGMRSKGFGLPKPLFILGMLLACQSRNSQAVNAYLQIFLGSRDYIEAQGIYRSLDVLCHSMLENRKDGCNYESADMLNLTGSADGDEPIDKILECNTPSLAKLVDQHLRQRSRTSERQNHVPPYCNYILWLGRLGLTTTLHHHWNAVNIQLPNLLKSALDPAYLFATAFLLAGDTHTALSVMKAGNPSGLDVDLAKDETSVDGYSRGRSVRNIIRTSYSMLGVKSHHVLQDFELDKSTMTPASPEEFLNRLSQLLMTDAPAIFKRPPFGSGTTLGDSHAAHLADYNGECGLLVPPARGHTPLYFKAERPLF